MKHSNMSRSSMRKNLKENYLRVITGLAWGHTVVQLFDTMLYKSEGGGIDS